MVEGHPEFIKRVSQTSVHISKVSHASDLNIHRRPETDEGLLPAGTGRGLTPTGLEDRAFPRHHGGQDLSRCRGGVTKSAKPSQDKSSQVKSS